ncbi:MAG TPA: hypothetical protein VES20_13620 [Bryobacteraceae bacterium]|nr:hypothetical protein [Bryobacteraceae bacterium]
MRGLRTTYMLNWAMHWGQGFLWEPSGALTLENATGVGAPPWTWPVDEQVLDLVHKGIYAFVRGALADRLIVGPAGVPAPMRPWAEQWAASLLRIANAEPSPSRILRYG